MRSSYAVTGVQRRLRAGSYVAAVVGSAAIGFHLWSALAQSHGPLMTSLMLTMSMVCVPCVVGVLRHCTAHSMTMLMVMSLCCATVNMVIIIAGSSAMSMGHGGSGAAVAVQMAASSTHAVLMVGVIGLEIATAAAAAVCVRRFNHREEASTPPESLPREILTTW